MRTTLFFRIFRPASRALAHWLLVVLIFGFAQSAFALTLSDGKIFQVKGGTQVVFNLDGNVKPKVQILHNPQRLVIDLPNASLGKLNAGLENSPDIKKLRVGKEGSTLRVIFDLSGTYHGRATIVKDQQYRLVVDIYRDVVNTPDKKPVATSQPPKIVTPAKPAQPTKPPEPTKPVASTPPKTETNPPADNANVNEAWGQASQKPPVASSETPDMGKPLATNTADGPPVTVIEPKANAKPAAPPATTAAPGSTYRTRKVRVIIDPGHGAHDSGAIGPKGHKEKTAVLAISLKLAEMINNDPNMEAILTRNSDTFLKLYDRVKFAREKKGDIFISIHANSVPATAKKTQAGAMVFILNRQGATSKLAKYLESSENASGALGGEDIIQVQKELRSLVYGMIQGAVIDESRLLATHILKQMKDIDNVFKHAIEGANFAVLSAPDVPSILVETTFISTPSEEKKLTQKAYQTKVAKAIYKGVAGFVNQRQHLTREWSN